MCVRCFTCNLFGGADTQHDSMSVVANVFARFFYGSPDLVISDIVAGFILLAAVQAHEESKELLEKNQVMSCEEGTATLADIRMGSIGLHSKIEEAFVSTTSASVTETIGPLSYNSKHPSSPSSPGGYSQSESGYDNDDMKLRESVIELAHFSHYAVGIYGWMLYIWSHPWSGTFRLTFSCFKKSLPYVHGDNLFRLHLTALQLETKLALDDIVYASFVNSICRPAFCVVIDREKKEIVIAVRGTLSLEDCLTDAVAYGVSMDEHAERFGCDGRGEFAHQGFLHAAESLYREINRLGVLDMLFDPNTSVQIVERELNTCEKGAYSDYGLVVCGHSLGAGTAVLLATMLKPKYPRLRCFAFSPPGCIVSHGIARSCSSYVTSITLGFDIIARTSMQSAEELRDRVIDLIGRSKVGKAAIIKQIVAWKKPHELLHDEDVSLNCPFGLQLANYRTMLQRIQASEPIHEMTIPGKLIHLRRPQVHDGGPGGCWVCCRPGSDGICCTARSNYDFEWSTAESFKSIKISRTMLDDHFPDKVHHVLQDCAKKIQARERRKNSTSSSCL
jgi:sn1-specific diacylglycerol lipase